MNLLIIVLLFQKKEEEKRLHTENQLHSLPGSALKVCVGDGWVVVVESEFSDRLWLSFSLALSKPNNYSTTQAVSLTESDSWLCPECQEKRSRKGRGRPKKQETQRSPSAADKDLNKKGQKAAGKEKFVKKTIGVKTVIKKQKMSKKYISDEDMTDTEEDTSREHSTDFRKVEKENAKTNPPQNKPSLKTVDKNKAGKEDRPKWEEAKKGREIINKGVAMSDSLSNSSDGVEDGSASIIRMPASASQLYQCYSRSDED